MGLGAVRLFMLCVCHNAILSMTDLVNGFAFHQNSLSGERLHRERPDITKPQGGRVLEPKITNSYKFRKFSIQI